MAGWAPPMVCRGYREYMRCMGYQVYGPDAQGASSDLVQLRGWADLGHEAFWLTLDVPGVGAQGLQIAGPHTDWAVAAPGLQDRLASRRAGLPAQKGPLWIPAITRLLPPSQPTVLVLVMQWLDRELWGGGVFMGASAGQNFLDAHRRPPAKPHALADAPFFGCLCASVCAYFSVGDCSFTSNQSMPCQC